MLSASMPTELFVLGLSVVMLLVHILAQAAAVTRERGLAWNIGPRDETSPPLGTLAARAQRALTNYGETWPAFIALALGLALSGRTGGTGSTGAVLWLCARVLYLPLYLCGVRFWRTAAYVVSLAGLVLMLGRLL
jgi:uncharacterized MAPEG superfamily protein